MATEQTITVTGTGTYISLSPTRLNFGSHPVGTTTAARTVTVTNVGAMAVTISSAAVGGSDPADFPIFSNTCGAAIAGGASCAISLKFQPTATGSRSATLVVNDDGGGSPQTVALVGNGT